MTKTMGCWIHDDWRVLCIARRDKYYWIQWISYDLHSARKQCECEKRLEFASSFSFICFSVITAAPVMFVVFLYLQNIEKKRNSIVLLRVPFISIKFAIESQCFSWRQCQTCAMRSRYKIRIFLWNLWIAWNRVVDMRLQCVGIYCGRSSFLWRFNGNGYWKWICLGKE